MSPEHTPSAFLVLPPPDREMSIQGVPVVAALAIGIAPAFATAGVMLGSGTLAVALAAALLGIGVVASVISLDF